MPTSSPDGRRDEQRLVHVVCVFGDRGRPSDPGTVHEGVQPVAGAVDNRLGAQGARPCGDAGELSARQGFDGTTVDDIAAAAGIGRRAFFRCFASQNDLLRGDFEAELVRREGLLVPPGDGRGPGPPARSSPRRPRPLPSIRPSHRVPDLDDTCLPTSASPWA
ncbi:TetR family transcriptional regulator [Streptomyces sp. NPDC002588]|uniref:TetR family transcriptional regulator n=1 Tax=Streptomyces sp. NPDC002588 TaxID=3154419 RepID=UPI00331CB413